MSTNSIDLRPDGSVAGSEPTTGGSPPEIFLRRESEVRSYCRAVPAVLASASGSVVRDVNGRQYLDFLAGAGSLNYGHNDPDLKSALVEYILADGIAHSLDLFTDAKQAFLETFEEVILRPRSLPYKVQFTGPTGANAVEAALKLARLVTGRQNVIAFTNAFHGMSLGALAVTGNRTSRMAPLQPLPAVTRLPYENYLGPTVDTVELLERMLDDPSSGVDQPAAILLETVQGEGGLNTASTAWLQAVSRAAREHGALLVVDDIQAGCGRTGSFFSFETAGIVPDIVVLSKSLSGFGLPLSVVLLHPDHDAWRPGQHNGTFRGNAHAFVTAKVALRKFWTSSTLAVDVARRAATVAEHLAELACMVPDAVVKGRGLMQGMDVRDPELASAITRACIEQGLIVESCGPRDEVVKLLPPLTTPDDQLLQGLNILGEAVRAAISSRPV